MNFEDVGLNSSTNNANARYEVDTLFCDSKTPKKSAEKGKIFVTNDSDSKSVKK